MKKESFLYVLSLTILIVCNPTIIISSDLHNAILRKDINSVNKLIEEGTDVDARDDNGNTPLNLAVLRCYLPAVQILLQAKADTNIADKVGNMPLHVATKYGYEEILNSLLASNAEINAQNNDGNTPLHLAAQKGEEDIIGILLGAGADINQPNQKGDTPLHLALGTTDVVVQQLINTGANINSQNKDGNTPLNIAVSKHYVPAVQILLKANADTNIANKSGNTPLHMAVERGHDEILNSLLASNAEINPQNNDGNTPLHLAVHAGNMVATQTLLNRGADVKSLNKIGKTPLFFALQNGFKDIAQQLIKKGAQIPGLALNAFMSLEEEDETHTFDINIRDALYNKIPIIGSVALLQRFFVNESYFNLWSVCLNKHEDIIVLIPAPYELLEAYGFDINRLDLIPQGSVVKTVKAIELKKIEPSQKEELKRQGHILLEHFKEIFNYSKKVSKRFYLVGHGSPGYLIGGILIPNFRYLLEIFNDINTEFLVIESCFTGGLNLVWIQQFITKQLTQQLQLGTKPYINYAIVSLSADAAYYTHGEAINLKKFFTLLNAFLKSPRWYFGRPQKRNGLSINDVLKPFYKRRETVFNLPSIRFPGTNSFFRAVNVDDMVIITYLTLLRLRRAYQFIERFAPGEEKKVSRIPTIEIPYKTKYVQIYPCNLSDLTLTIQGNIVPRFISRIPGKSNHFIKTIKYMNDTAPSFKKFLEESLIFPLQVTEETSKAWFVEKLEFPNQLIEGLVVFYDSTKKRVTIIYKVKKEKEAEFDYIKQGRLQESSEFITSENYYSTIEEIFKKTRAHRATLREATAGYENPKSEEKAFKVFKAGIKKEI